MPIKKKGKAENAISMLKSDHEKVKELFDKFEKATNSAAKEKIVAEALMELKIHATVEEEFFYPALEGTSSTRAWELVSTTEEGYRTVEQLLKGMSPQDRNFDEKMTQLIDAVNHHVEREEEEILDEARKTLSEYRLEELGLEMEDRRRLLTQLTA